MIKSKSGKSFGAYPISMGGLRFAEPVKAKAKRTKKVAVEQCEPSAEPVVAQPEAGDQTAAQTEATLERDIAA
jgi:hypothetical protein